MTSSKQPIANNNRLFIPYFDILEEAICKCYTINIDYFSLRMTLFIKFNQETICALKQT